MMLPCVCAGKSEDCSECGGFGMIPFVGDPAAEIPPHYPMLFRLADAAKDGHWPIGNGTLSETQAFFDFCHLTWNYQAAYEAKLNG